MDGLEPGLLKHFQPWADDVLRGAEEGNWQGASTSWGTRPWQSIDDATDHYL